jgi:putative FmdB family regulatory protein
MPIYEYRCPKCGVFDHMQKITERPLKKCPTCKGKVSKLVSNPAFHLKGGGWYVTDYARKGSGGGAGESKSSDASDASSSEGKADKKSDKADKKAGKKGETSASAAA